MYTTVNPIKLAIPENINGVENPPSENSIPDAVGPTAIPRPKLPVKTDKNNPEFLSSSASSPPKAREGAKTSATDTPCISRATNIW